MSIVFLSPTGQTGGAEAALHELLAGLRESHPSWSLSLIVASDGPLVARVEALGVPVQIVPFPASLARLGDWSLRAGLWPRVVFMTRCARVAWPTLTYLRRLRRLLRAMAPDIVHTNGLKMHLLGAWARPRNTAVLWHLHDYAGRRPFMARLLRLCAHRCSTVVANSQSVAADVRQVCGEGVEIHPVWNAVDIDRFSPRGPRLDLDALSGLATADGLLRVGLVATFARWKGHGTFLKALAMLPSSLPVRGYVIGGPVYETAGSQTSLAELREQADSLGLGSRVGFTGFVQDSAAAMRSLDIIVHASTDPEPFGLVIAEGMACGKPVVASRAGGALELTQSGTNALEHTPGDAQALAQRIEELARDAGLRQRLGDTGRATAERCFTRHRLAGDLTPIYQALVHVH
ncbi:MAG TPA: glycosyltransferase family 4 protein [Vicinamibacterales bacterium]|nr:glycosyltransferase family 4 protein [Vicinamibacterales bacterium]